jgi:hypothetical protein
MIIIYASSYYCIACFSSIIYISVRYVVLISHALTYIAKTYNKLQHMQKSLTSSHSNSNAFRNPRVSDSVAKTLVQQ